MPSTDLCWDERVVPPALLQWVHRLQKQVPCRVAGGAALSGLHLKHRLSNDIDLFCDTKESVREVLGAINGPNSFSHENFSLLRDGGSFVRGRLVLASHELEVDIVYEPSAALAPRDNIGGVIVESLADMRANKLTCLLSRSEPRDLVDLHFLDRASFAPEDDLEAALSKDAGIDPAILAMLLAEFPVSPLPQMLQPISEDELRHFAQSLASRFRERSLPAAPML